MVSLLKKSQEKREMLREDSFGKYLENTTGKTTVNGTVVSRKFSWYKRILGLF